MLVSPSILAADFGHLASEIEMLNSSKADMVHIDVMDGVFVPNISFGFPVMKFIKDLSAKPLDVHLMIVQPERYIEQVRDSGSRYMTVHYEACTHLNRCVQQIHNCGMMAGVALNPSTPVCVLRDIVSDLDLVLLMSVNPGFGGQKFIAGTISKIHDLQTLIAERHSHALIEIDGGVNQETGKPLAQAGAQVLVAGSHVFSAPNPADTIAALKAL